MTAVRPTPDSFERKPVALMDRITADESSPWPVEPKRYRLVVARGVSVGPTDPTCRTG